MQANAARHESPIVARTANAPGSSKTSTVVPTANASDVSIVVPTANADVATVPTANASGALSPI